MSSPVVAPADSTATASHPLEASTHSQIEDWDCSMILPAPVQSSDESGATAGRATDGEKDTNAFNTGTKGRRSLSDLLRRHAEKGSEVRLSDEEEDKITEELGKWVSAIADKGF
jgi:hypothetical protein